MNLPPLAVPVIDVTSPAAPAAIDAAASTVGAFYATHTGVAQASVDALLDRSRAFFGAPPAVKNRYAAAPPTFRGYTPMGDEKLSSDAAAPADLKEGLYFGREEASPGAKLPLHGPNVWPADGDAPGLRPAVEAAFAELEAAATAMLPVVGDALGVGTAFFVDAFRVGPPMSFLRPLRYAPVPSDVASGRLGAGAHTDFGFVSLLVTDGAPGLQVDAGGGDWRAVPPLADAVAAAGAPPPPPGEAAVFVNVGDMLERWSNGRWRSAPHRVALPTAKERYSAAFFFDPPFECVVDCVVRRGEPPVAASVRYGDYLLAKYRAIFDSFE